MKTFKPAATCRRVTRSQTGVTIVEMMIGAFIVGVISFASFGFYQHQHNAYLQQTDASDTQHNLRITMNELSRHIRQAGYEAYGVIPVESISSGKILLIRFSDGDSVRTKAFFLLTDTSTARSNLWTMLDGESPELFTEGIDSLNFTIGGAGTAIDWVDIELMARSSRQGFQSVSNRKSKGKTDSTAVPGDFLYRRLKSKIMLRN